MLAVISLNVWLLLGIILLAAILLLIFMVFKLRYRNDVVFDELEAPAAEIMPHPIPDEALYGNAPLQLLNSGWGPLFVRSYQVDIINPTLSKEELKSRIVEDINNFCPKELASFEKTNGDNNNIDVGDEYYIHIKGPWDGPVRVIDSTSCSFTFATLKNHLEAGEISFSLKDLAERKNAYRFVIQSWARSSNFITNFFYNVLKISRFAQSTMWIYFCNKILDESGGEIIGKIKVMTHKTKVSNIKDQMPGWKRYKKEFDKWKKADLNFDINKTEEFHEKLGWKIDDYLIGLPGEKPGPPVLGGSFETAKNIIRNYEFPDPSFVKGVFIPDEEIKGRIMIIKVRFMFMNFLLGVKIWNVTDEERVLDTGEKVYVWGYSYRTLEGHFEMGEMFFEVWKYDSTGEVKFRIHAYSKPDKIPQLFYRIGFKLFGRKLQIKFSQTSLRRMQKLVLENCKQDLPEEEFAKRPYFGKLDDKKPAGQKAKDIEEDNISLEDNEDEPKP